MGMAPYGQAKYSIDAIRPAFSVEGLEFRNNTGRFAAGIAQYFHSRLYQHRFDNICAACQQSFEEIVVEWTRNAIKATGISNVTAAGGAFLNVKANKLIREMPEVSKLYVYPASDDGARRSERRSSVTLNCAPNERLLPNLTFRKPCTLDSNTPSRKWKQPPRRVAYAIAA